MKTLRLAWLILRLARYLEKNRLDGASASVLLVQERTDSSTYRALCEEALRHGIPAPPPRLKSEVGVWLDVGAPHKVYDAATLEGAIRRALEQAPRPE